LFDKEERRGGELDRGQGKRLTGVNKGTSTSTHTHTHTDHGGYLRNENIDPLACSLAVLEDKERDHRALAAPRFSLNAGHGILPNAADDLVAKLFNRQTADRRPAGDEAWSGHGTPAFFGPAPVAKMKSRRTHVSANLRDTTR